MKTKLSTELTPEVVNTIVTKCTEKKASPAESAFAAAKCIHEHNPKHTV